MAEAQLASTSQVTTRIKLNASFWRHWNCIPFSEDVVPSSLFLKHRHYLVFDLETQRLVQEVGGWDHVDKLGVSVACAYDSKTDQYLSFRVEIKRLHVFDIMYDLEALTRQRFLKLEAVAQGTLGTGKSADGLMAV